MGILPPLPGRDGHLHSLPHAVEDTQLPALADPHMGGEDSPPSCPLLLCRTICQPLSWPACAPTLAKRKGTQCQASLQMIHIDVARCNPAGNLAEQADAVRANGLIPLHHSSLSAVLCQAPLLAACCYEHMHNLVA